MPRRYLLLATTAATVIYGCSATGPRARMAAPSPLQTAIERAQHELDCPSATGRIISQNPINGPSNGDRAPELSRIDYKVGVDGCGQRETYFVFCQISNGACIAGTAGERK